MGKRRMISADICANPKFAKLKYRQQLLLIGLIINADDQGRLRGNPNLIRSIVFPYSNISPNTIDKDLSCIAGNGTILCYQIDGQAYIQMINWWKYQRGNWAAPSDQPAPPEWKDRINYRHGGKILTFNWGDKANTCNEQGIALSKNIEYPNQSTFKDQSNSYSEGKGSEGLSEGKGSEGLSEGKGSEGNAEHQRNPEENETHYRKGKWADHIKH